MEIYGVCQNCSTYIELMNELMKSHQNAQLFGKLLQLMRKFILRLLIIWKPAKSSLFKFYNLIFIFLFFNLNEYTGNVPPNKYSAKQ